MKLDTYLWLGPKFGDVQKVSFSNPYLKFQNTLKIKTCITEPNRVPATMFLLDNKAVKNKKLFEAYFLTCLFFNMYNLQKSKMKTSKVLIEIKGDLISSDGAELTPICIPLQNVHFRFSNKVPSILRSFYNYSKIKRTQKVI